MKDIVKLGIKHHLRLIIILADIRDQDEIVQHHALAAQCLINEQLMEYAELITKTGIEGYKSNQLKISRLITNEATIQQLKMIADLKNEGYKWDQKQSEFEKCILMYKDTTVYRFYTDGSFVKSDAAFKLKEG